MNIKLLIESFDKFLNENDNLTSLLEGKLKDLQAKHPDLSDKIRWLSDEDPSRKNKYLNWSVEMLHQGEDSKSIINVLNDFHNNIPRIPKESRSIDSFSSVREVKDLLQSLGVSKGEVKRQALGNKETIILYKDDSLQIVQPLTKESAIFNGKGTTWCIAYSEDEGSTGNMFDQYTEQGMKFFIFKLSKTKDKYAIAYYDKQRKIDSIWDKHNDKIRLITLIQSGVDKTVLKELLIKYNIPFYDEGSFNFSKREDRDKVLKIFEKGEGGSIFQEIPEDFQIELVENSPTAIQYINKPTEKVQLYLVRRDITDGKILQYINDPTEQTQPFAINKSLKGLAIKYIENPTEKAQLLAINKSKSGVAFQYIKNPTEGVQEKAVEKDASAIGWINNPSERLQKIAVTKLPRVIKYLKNPSEDLQILAIKAHPKLFKDLQEPTERVQLFAVKENPRNIKHIKNPSERVKQLADKTIQKGNK